MLQRSFQRYAFSRNFQIKQARRINAATPRELCLLTAIKASTGRSRGICPVPYISIHSPNGTFLSPVRYFLVFGPSGCPGRNWIAAAGTFASQLVPGRAPRFVSSSRRLVRWFYQAICQAGPQIVKEGTGIVIGIRNPVILLSPRVVTF